ncbi:MAG: HlyD family secretion protein [Paludibacter sp.]|nr:HlyD family secretion protein [Paludibacter sp.]
MENETNDIELRSEEFQEVLSRIPSWMQRYGITLIFCILAGLLAGSAFFKYPDIISAPIVVSTENLPVDITAKISGRIDTLFVAEKQKVNKGQILGILENTARWNDVLLLQKMLDSTDMQHLSPLQLGDLQNQYSNYLKSKEDLQFFITTDYYNKKIQTVERQKIIQQNIVNQSIKQLNLSKRQIETAQNQFSTDSMLFAKNVLSAFEFENSKNARLQALQNYENSKTGIENQKLGIVQLEQQIFDLNQQKDEQLAQLKLNLNAACDQLKAQTETFKQTYFLISQTNGVATFTKYWQRNQNITVGETVLTVVPPDNQQIIGKIMLPPQGAGKVKIGQTVNVKLDNFPYMEYGMVKVKITNIALVPVNQNNTRAYVLEVAFPDNLKTSYNKTLTFSQQMSGTAEIITEDLSLLERLLYPLKAIWKK